MVYKVLYGSLLFHNTMKKYNWRDSRMHMIGKKGSVEVKGLTEQGCRRRAECT